MIKFTLIFLQMLAAIFFRVTCHFFFFLKFETKFEVLKQKYQKMFQQNAEEVSDWRHNTHHNDSKPNDTKQSNKNANLSI